MRIFNAEIEVPEDKIYFCYRYGCNHWYACLKDNGKHESGDQSECCGFIGDKNKATYKSYRID